MLGPYTPRSTSKINKNGQSKCKKKQTAIDAGKKMKRWETGSLSLITTSGQLIVCWSIFTGDEESAFYKMFTLCERYLKCCRFFFNELP